MNDLFICLTLKSIHTLDAGTHVELKFVIPHCNEVEGGDLTLRVTPEMGRQYMLGDKLTVRMKGL